MTRRSKKSISIENHGVVYFLEGVIVWEFWFNVVFSAFFIAEDSEGHVT